MNWTIIIILLLTSLFLYLYPHLVIKFVNSFLKVVPFGCAAIRTRFDEFESKHHNGWIFTLPVVHKLEIIPLETLDSILIVANAQSKNGDSIVVKAILNYKKDYELLEDYYFAVKSGKDKYEQMITGSITNIIGIIASTRTLEELMTKKEALWLALNCYARLSKMPHDDSSIIGINPPITVKNGQILGFYEKNGVKIKELVSHEGENKEDRSEIEKNYGIDVTAIDIKEVVPSEETQKAINKKKHDEAMARAADVKKKLMKDFRDVGLSPEASKQAAEVSLGQTTKNDAHSVLGLEGLIKVNVPEEKSNG